jgi:4-hydroxy-2-oxoglutarate aldolase
VQPLTLSGVFPPLVTPFTEDGALDLAAFEANLEGYSREELGGYLVLGSNGEAASLDEDEKLALVRAARARAGSRPVLVGADAALVLTPSFYKSQMTPEALRRHFEAVAEASPIPVLVYSVPQFTGLTFSPALAVALAAHPGIAGMKESSGDVGLLSRIVGAVPAGFRVLCGSAPVFYPALCAGAAAGILAVACCAPAPAIALHRAFAAGDHAQARRLQEAMAPLAAAVTATYGVAGLKAALDLSGRRGGRVRAPLQPVSETVREELRGLLGRAQQPVG